MAREALDPSGEGAIAEGLPVAARGRRVGRPRRLESEESGERLLPAAP